MIFEFMKIRTLEILEDIKPGGSEKGIKALKEAQKLEQKFIKEKKTYLLNL